MENRTEKPKETAQVKLSFQESHFEANSLVRVEELSFSYGKRAAISAAFVLCSKSRRESL
ncbi:hypothetical protein GCM10020331_070530 [Ectobacillus funiculus]